MLNWYRELNKKRDAIFQNKSWREFSLEFGRTFIRIRYSIRPELISKMALLENQRPFVKKEWIFGSAAIKV